MSDLLMEEVLSEWLQARMSERKFDPLEVRLSESGACLRKRVLRALGFPGRPLSEEDAATFEEGNLMENFTAQLLKERYSSIQQQVPVRVFGDGLPDCEGHVDFLVWVQSEEFCCPLIVECKTVNRYSAAFGLPKPEHVMQVQAYMHFGRFGVQCTEAEIVYWLKGRRLDWKVFPVKYSPEVGARVEADLRHLWGCVQAGEVPPIPDGHAPDAFPCYWRTVSEASEHHCEMWDHCWQQAEAPESATALVSANVIREYAELRKKHSALVTEAEELKERMRSLEEKLALALGNRSGALEAGGVRVKGTYVKGRVTYDVDAAVLAGAVSAGALAPFRKEGQGYWRWTLTMKGGAE